MTIHEEENKLFDAWEKGLKGFARDGVVSEKDYLDSDLKIVFILKEVNDPDSEGSDLRDYLCDGGGWRTWNNVARWVHGVRNRASLPKWQFYEGITDDFRKENLKSICALNLKKESGGSSAKWVELENATKRDREYIKDQYSFYKPDITFCCGKPVDKLFSDIFDLQGNKWGRTSRGVWFYKMQSGEHVIAINHPQQSIVRSSLLFYELVDAVKEIYGPS